MGLAIVRNWSANDGRAIWVESEIDRGSTFHFTGEFGVREEPIQSTAVRQSDLLGLPVLVVDDNAINRQVLEETPALGHEADSRREWRAASETMEKACKEGRPFPLVLTDCMMPEMDGFQLAERINQDPALATSTIIMLTSAGERGDASECMKVGIAAYLLKPIKQSDLLLTMSQWSRTSSDRGAARLITRHSIRESKQGCTFCLAEDKR